MQWWDHLKPQIMEHLRELCFRGYYSDDVKAILENDNWMKDEQFRYRVFNYESAEFTLQQLCDIYSMLTSDMFGGDAIRGSLKYNILALIKQSEFQRPEEIEIKEEVA